jgi:3-phosphoshikimate 1-carboxyvinyltransferase
VGNAGTAARFLAAFVCLGKGVYRLSGVPRMRERPQAALFQALRELGYRVESESGDDKLPVKICTGRADLPVSPNAQQRVPTKFCKVSIEESSQFASALLLCAKQGGWKIEIVGENAEESPYVEMTRRMLEVFPSGGTFQIEPDASSGSYFWAAGQLDAKLIASQSTDELAVKEACPTVTVASWPDSRWQIDEAFRSLFAQLEMREENFFRRWLDIPAANGIVDQCLAAADLKPLTISRMRDLGDSIMTAIIIAPFVYFPTRFTDLGRLRVQECERVVALRTELTKCGAKVVEEDDTLTVYPSQLHGAEIETYNDHRIAMCFAVLGLKVPGIKIKNPSCVKKTFPNFFQKLASPPPNGLGAEIWEIEDGKRTRKLSGQDLFAD